MATGLAATGPPACRTAAAAVRTDRRTPRGGCAGTCPPGPASVAMRQAAGVASRAGRRSWTPWWCCSYVPAGVKMKASTTQAGDAADRAKCNKLGLWYSLRADSPANVLLVNCTWPAAMNGKRFGKVGGACFQRSKVGSHACKMMQAMMLWKRRSLQQLLIVPRRHQSFTAQHAWKLRRAMC